MDKRIIEILLFCGITILGGLYGLQSINFVFSIKVFFLSLSTFSFFLYGYLFNDWCGFLTDKADIAKKNRISQKIGRSKTLYFTLIFGIIFLLLITILKVLIIGLILLFLSILYSYPKINLKTFPFMPYIIHFIAGSCYFLLGFSAFNKNLRTVLPFLIFFSLIYIAGQINQELTDYEIDNKTNVFTTPHLFGKKISFYAENILFLSTIVPFFFVKQHKYINIHIFLIYTISITFYVLYALIFGIKNHLDRNILIKLKKIYHLIYFILGLLLVVNRIIFFVRI